MSVYDINDDGRAKLIEELKAIRARMGDLSECGFGDMEGADAHEFQEAEALYVSCGHCAKALAHVIKVFEQPDREAEPPEHDPFGDLAGNIGEWEDHFNADGSARH